MLTLTLALLAPAQAAGHGLDLQLGTIGADDPSYNVVDERDTWRTFGATGALAVHPRVALLGSYHVNSRGADNGLPGDVGSSRTPGAGEGFTAAYTGHTVGLGVRGDVEPTPYFLPYLSAQALLQLGTLRLDDDSDADDNLNQLIARGAAPGFSAAAGGELIMAPDWSVSPTAHLELGYALTGRQQLGDVGELYLRGFYLRTGVGVEF